MNYDKFVVEQLAAGEPVIKAFSKMDGRLIVLKDIRNETAPEGFSDLFSISLFTSDDTTVEEFCLSSHEWMSLSVGETYIRLQHNENGFPIFVSEAEILTPSLLRLYSQSTVEPGQNVTETIRLLKDELFEIGTAISKAKGIDLFEYREQISLYKENYSSEDIWGVSVDEDEHLIS